VFAIGGFLMKLVLEKAGDFQKSIEALAVLIDEAEFVLDERGLALKATDPSQISMVDFLLEKNSFRSLTSRKRPRLALTWIT
jgi:DNA polymerase III sliding clamp (beta) subunit (PCNA family)